MNSAELREALDTLNMTSAALAKRLGIKARTVRRWKAGAPLNQDVAEKIEKMVENRLAQ